MEFFELRTLAQNLFWHVKLPRETIWVPMFASVVWRLRVETGAPGYLTRWWDRFALEHKVRQVRNVSVPNDVI